MMEYKQKELIYIDGIQQLYDNVKKPEGHEDKPLPFRMIAINSIERWRGETFWYKEPKTIKWIQEYIKDGDVFYDVGANIGMYSLFVASIYPNSTVVSFEPSVTCYGRLLENILLNDFKNIRAYYIAISDHEGAEPFHDFLYLTGGNGNQLHSTVQWKDKHYKKPMISYIAVLKSIDNVVEMTIPPDHIKIDTDGHEMKVLAGMKKALASPKLKSVLIEVDENKESAEDVKSIFYRSVLLSKEPIA